MDASELRAGQLFRSPGRTVSESDVVTFSYVSGDFHPAVSDYEWAKSRSLFKRTIAHGLLVMSMSEGLFMRSNIRDQESTDFTLGFNNVKFPNAVLPGDTIFSEFEIIEARESKSRPGSYVVTPRATVRNQRSQIVCQYEHPMLFVRSP